MSRVLVTRHPGHHDHHDDHASHEAGSHDHPDDHDRPGDYGGCCGGDRGGEASLEAQLRAALALLPPVLGGAPSQPLDVGRTSRVVTPAQRRALAVRDGGCVFPDCDRPLAWCEAHHLWHWLDGGPTDLDNLALLCRAHHRAVHEGGWQLTRAPDRHLIATPPHRTRRTTHRHRHPTAA